MGPNMAASLLAMEYGYPQVFMLCTLASLSACAVYALAYYRIRTAMSDQTKSALQPG